MKINLHTHSKFSLDGELEVQELIDYMKKNNCNIISITDHDTCDAYKYIEDDSNIQIITGMEADAIVNNHTYDFLCYDFDLDEVMTYAANRYETVEKRQQKIFNALVEQCQNNNIVLNNITSYQPQKEYAHAAIFRMLNQDFLDQYHITSVSDLYRLSTIDNTFPLYIDMHIVWPDLMELREIIHYNYGYVFLAHPYRYNRDVKEVLDEVKDYIDGIEICNNPQNRREVEYLYEYAKENNLIVSCGSDFHGNSHYNLDCDYLTEDMIDDILSWAE